MAGPGTYGCCRTDQERQGLSQYHWRLSTSLHGICLLKWKWSLRTNAPCTCHMTRTELDWFQVHNTEFMLTFAHLTRWVLFRRSTFWVSFNSSSEIKNNHFGISRKSKTVALITNATYPRPPTKNLWQPYQGGFRSKVGQNVVRQVVIIFWAFECITLSFQGEKNLAHDIIR